MKKLLITIMTMLSTFSSAAVVAQPALVAANHTAAHTAVCEGIGKTGGDCGDDESELNKAVQAVVNILSIVVGVVAVIMIIIGGLKYVTSSGDSNKVSSAKNTILYAIVGLVIVALSQFIVRFVLDRATR